MAASYHLTLQPVPMERIVLTQVRDPVLGLDESHEVHLGPTHHLRPSSSGCVNLIPVHIWSLPPGLELLLACKA